MLSSEAFHEITTKLVQISERFCEGRLIFAHEGGYSKDYVPFCGLAVIEALSGNRITSRVIRCMSGLVLLS